MEKNYTSEWSHDHYFHLDNHKGEKKARAVMMLTIVVMFIEISAGYLTGSMALLADGWHMATHAAALGITAFAYIFSRKNCDNPIYCFGTGKVSILGGYTSAIVLILVALIMAVESFQRFVSPETIRFDEAIIVALVTGKFIGLIWLDPLMGIVGAVIIMRWGYGLIKDTGSILLDSNVKQDTLDEIKNTIETINDSRVIDLHVWQVGPKDYSGIISIVTHDTLSADYYKEKLNHIPYLNHLVIEVNHAHDRYCVECDS